MVQLTSFQFRGGWFEVKVSGDSLDSGRRVLGVIMGFWDGIEKRGRKVRRI